MSPRALLAFLLVLRAHVGCAERTQAGGRRGAVSTRGTFVVGMPGGGTPGGGTGAGGRGNRAGNDEFEVRDLGSAESADPKLMSPISEQVMDAVQGCKDGPKPTWAHHAFSTTSIEESPKGKAPEEYIKSKRYSVTNYIAEQIEGCETQYLPPLPGELKPNAIVDSCTSCKEDYGIAMASVRYKTGSCNKYRTAPYQFCASTSKDRKFTTKGFGARTYIPGSGDVMCTKVARIALTVRLWGLPNPHPARTYFSKVMNGKHKGAALAYCHAWKSTICQQDGSLVTCDVKKVVKCVEVCKMEAHSDTNNHARFGALTTKARDRKSCYKDLCNGEYGYMACHEAALMF